MSARGLITSATTTSIIVGLLGGAVASMSLPPFGFWPVGPLGIAMLLLALEDSPVGRRVAIGWAFGLGLFVPALWWAQHFNWYGAAVLMIIEAMFFAAAAAAMVPGRGRTLTAIGALVLAEMLRDRWPLGGLPIGGLPLGQVDGPLLGIARLAGLGGLMMGIVVAGAGIRVLTTALAARGAGAADAPRRALHGFALLGAVALVALVGALASSGGPPVAYRTVAAVQGGGARGTSQEQVDPTSVTNASLDALDRVPPNTQLTVLPEDVVGLDGPYVGSWQAAALSQQARRLSTTLLAGVTTPVGATKFNNFVVAIDPTGTVIGRVEKVHRVPFGEYIPARSLFTRLADTSGVPRDAIPGTGDEVLHTPAGTLGLMISYEVFFPARSAASVADGAQLLVVPTNTTSYPTSQMPSQELAAARLQAVMRGRDLVQASPTGYSAIITSSGSVSARSALSARTALSGTVALRDGRTIYDRLGDLPVLVVALGCVVLGQVRARRRPHSSS